MRVKIWWESNKKKIKRILWSELLAISKQIAYLFALLSIWLTWKPVSRPVILWPAGFHAYSSENLTRISSFRHSKAIHSEILIEGKRENTITMCATALGVKTVEKSHLIELKEEKKPFNQIRCVLYWCNTAGTNQFLRILFSTVDEEGGNNSTWSNELCRWVVRCCPVGHLTSTNNWWPLKTIKSKSFSTF